MNAVIVTIGDEILIGQIVDTNSAWMAEKLTLSGINVQEIVSISDTPEHITTTLDRFVGKTEVVILTGGLGPTKDDLTKETLTGYFGGKLEMNEEVLEQITEFFEKRGRTMIESNRQQAMLPDNCTVLPNHMGTAQGMWFRKDNTQIFSIPGVPYEMKPLIRDHIIPALHNMGDIPELRHRTVMTEGVPESYLAELIGKWEESLPDCLKLAYLPRPGIVRLRITARGRCVDEADSIMEESIGALKKIIPKHIYGYDEIALEEVVGSLLREHDLKVSTAESCTGGNIARLITSVPGSSEYFTGSVIAYSNEVKVRELGVKQALIDAHGAVSEQVVESMAAGVMERFGTGAAIAVSGIAGPDGGTEEKPVGTVWLAAAAADRMVSKKFRFGGDRALIIQQSSMAGLGLMRRLLLGFS